MTAHKLRKIERLMKSATTAMLVCGAWNGMVYANDFHLEGAGGTDWTLFCPDSEIKSALPEYASNGQCRILQTALENGTPPANIWERHAPAVGKLVLPIIEQVYVSLNDMRFPDPKLSEQSGGYRINLGPDFIMESERDSDFNYGFFSGHSLWVSVDAHITGDGMVDAAELANTTAHEYFHAVQAAFPNGISHDDWLVEGTANYVGDRFEAIYAGTAFSWRDARDFSKGLTDVSEEQGGSNGYENDIFFAMLSRIMNGRGTDEPGMTGFDVNTTSPAYLKTIWDNMEGSGTTLQNFAEAVPLADPQGRRLYELYPLVMRDLTYFPDHDGKTFLFGPNGNSAPTEFAIRATLEAGWSATIPRGPFDGIQTHFYEINTSDFPETGRMLVEITDPQNDEAAEQSLHLAIHGTSYSRPTNPTSHNVGTIEKTGDTVMFAVSHIAPFEAGTGFTDQPYEIKLSWLSGGACEYDTVYGGTRLTAERQQAANMGMPDANAFFDTAYPVPAQYLAEYGSRDSDGKLTGDPAIQPHEGSMTIKGGSLRLSGRACTHHAAAAPLAEAGLLGNAMGFSAGSEAREMAGDLSMIAGAADALIGAELDEDRQLNILDAISLFTDGSLMGTDLREASVIFSVFSPDLYGFYQGMPALAEAGPTISGVGGWGGDTSAALTFILPGIKLTDLEVGRSYPAITLAPEGGSGGMPLAGRWDGKWTDVGPIGTSVSLASQRLTGMVEITDLTGGMVRGRFDLRGIGEEAEQVAEIQDIDGEDQRVVISQEQRTVSVSASGAFAAPTAVTGVPIFRHILGLRSVGRTNELDE